MNIARLWFAMAALGFLLAFAGVAGLVIGTRHLASKAAMVVVGLGAGAGGMAIGTRRNRR